MKKWLKLTARKTVLTLLVVLVAVSSSLQAWPVEATGESIWINNGSFSFVDEGPGTSAAEVKHGIQCSPQDFKTMLWKNRREEEATLSGCLSQFTFGELTRNSDYFRPKNAEYAGKLSNIQLLPLNHPDRLFRLSSANDMTRPADILSVYDNGSSTIKKGSYPVNGVSHWYTLDGSYDERLKRSDGYDMKILRNQMGFSANGKWMLARETSGKVIKVNLDTLGVTAIASVGGGWPSPPGSYHFAISNDGRYGFVSGGTSTSTTSQLFDLSTCDAPNPADNLEVVAGCGNRNITTDLSNHTGQAQHFRAPQFSSDSTNLTGNLVMEGEDRRIAITASGFEYSGLDYLALGDSFASGEGDLEEGNYLEGTDVSPNSAFPIGEKCHLSRKSYPFLLAQKMNLSGARFKSVACSGATAKDIVAETDYYGQQDRLMNDEGRTVSDIENMQREALDDFTPGRTAQIDFVEKYKPKAVSISVGGNDIDFSKVMTKCLLPTTCGYADTPSQKRSKAQEVQSLTHRLERVYEKIHEKSRNTKIYVIGYPKIVKKDGSCALNVRFNEVEREFLDEGVQYINAAIQAAAQRAGVAYVDVEGSQGESVLCGNDAEKSMNGLTRGDDQLQTIVSIVSNHFIPGIGNESYHPNQKGHAKMADAIWSETNSQGLINYQHCNAPSLNICPDAQVSAPTIPSYFGPDLSLTLPRQADILEPWARPGDTRNFKAPYLLKPNSNVGIEIHSDPVELGVFTTDSSGELNEDIEIPETLEPGVHTVHLTGTLLSDEEVHMYQTILVAGTENDVDNNGVNDSLQECYFVEPANADADFDGVDDSCDGDINEPRLYQVRNGNVDNNENEDWLYVERNTRAASITGIQNDYDPDEDGWAIVGQGTTSADSGEAANFWVDAQNVPHVSMRHPETGCTQFTPVDLAVVEQNQTRGLLQEAANTDTCRKEASDFDTDWDGTPDDVQVLYKARNGDVNNGESVEDVYIERNIVAAEAQLGITDFADSQSGWSVVGISDGGTMQGPVIGEVIIENGIPYICVDHVSNGQIVLTPEILTYVKQSENRKLKVETSANISCGS